VPFGALSEINPSTFCKVIFALEETAALSAPFEIAKVWQFEREEFNHHPHAVKEPRMRELFNVITFKRDSTYILTEADAHCPKRLKFMTVS